VTSVTAHYVWLHLDGEEYLHGSSKPLMKKNGNVQLVAPEEGAEMVHILVGGHRTIDRSNLN
jgi:hypothetical protein